MNLKVGTRQRSTDVRIFHFFYLICDQCSMKGYYPPAWISRSWGYRIDIIKWNASLLQVHRLFGRSGAKFTESFNNLEFFMCVYIFLIFYAWWQWIKLWASSYTYYSVALWLSFFLYVQVLFTGFSYGGLSELPEKDYISCSMGSTIAGEIGMFGYKPSMLMDMLAGKRVEVSARLGPYMRTFSCDCSPTDLETALQVCLLSAAHKHQFSKFFQVDLRHFTNKFGWNLAVDFISHNLSDLHFSIILH